jgi:WD40 repeat protein
MSMSEDNLVDSSVLPEGDLRLRVEDRDEIVEADIEPINDKANEDDDGDSYTCIPEHADLPESPFRSGYTGLGFWATIGVIPTKIRASCLAYGPGSQWGLAGHLDDVQILNMTAGEMAARFCEHQGLVTCVALSPNGRSALSGDEDGNLLLWDLASRAVTHRLHSHNGSVCALAVSPTAEHAATAGYDGVTRLWELAGTGWEYPLARVGWRDEITDVTFSQDGCLLLAGGSDGRIDMWAVNTGAFLRSFLGADGPIACVRCAAGVVTATVSPGAVKVPAHPSVWQWNADTGQARARVENRGAPKYIPHCVTLDQTGKRLLIAGRSATLADQYLPAVEARAAASKWLSDVGEAFRDFFRLVERPAHLAPAEKPKTAHSLEVRSLTTGGHLHSFARGQGDIIRLAVSPDNTRILAALSDGNVKVFAMPEI